MPSALEGERAKLVLEQLPAVVWTTDTELRITTSTGGGLASVGVSPDRIPSKPVGSFMPSDEQRSIIRAAHLRALGGEKVSYELHWDTHSLSCHVEPLRDATGCTVGCIGVALDISGRVRAEQALRAAHDELEQRVAERTVELARANWELAHEVTERAAAQAKVHAVLESMADAHVALDHDWRVTDINPSMCRSLGVARKDVLGRVWWQVLPSEFGKLYREQYQLAFDTGAPVQFEVCSPSPSRWVDVRVFPTPEGIAVFERDITASVRAQAEREERQRRQALLIDVSEKILAATTVQGVLEEVVEAARALTGAGCGSAVYGPEDLRHAVGVESHRTGTEACPVGRVATGGTSSAVVKALRNCSHSHLSGEVMVDLLGDALASHAPGHIKEHLLARLEGADGVRTGFIALGNKGSGPFTSEDEALITQLAATTSLALRHVEARAEAERRAAVLEAVFDAMVEPVLVRDATGIVEKANPAAIAAMGLDPTGVERTELARRLALRNEQGARLEDRELPGTRALAGELVRGERIDITNAASGEDRTILVSAAPLTEDKAVSGTVAVWHDVTALKRAEDTLKDALTDARQRQREVSALLEAARAVLRHDEFTEAVSAIFAVWKQLTGAELGLVALVRHGPTGRHLELVTPSQSGCQVETRDRMPLEGLLAEACEVGAPRWTNSFAMNDRLTRMPAGHPAIRNVLLAPLVLEGDVAGLVAVANTSNGFAERDAQLATAFAELAAVALARSRARELRDASEKRVLASLREKEVLLQEIHHRVKNNLQVIASMLSLQANHLGGSDEEARLAFRESQNRVRTLALIHEKLYRTSDLAHISFREYIQDLGTYLVHSFRGTGPAVTLAVEMDEVFFDIDTAVPLALLINELVSNSMKHAFAGRGSGEITIGLGFDPGSGCVLTVADDGVGFPEGLDHEATDSLGLQLVNALAQQIGGTLSLERGAGTRFTIRFPRGGPALA